MKSKKRIWGKSARPYLMLLPTFAIIAIFMLYPIFNTFFLSVQDYVMTNLDGAGFIGLEIL